jgi:hypothetical protein
VADKKKAPIKVDLGAPTLHTKKDKETAFLFEKFIELHPDEVPESGRVDPDRVVDWAFESGIYKPKPTNPRDQLKRRISRHLGHRYLVDKQGRTVRALVAVPIESPDEGGGRKFFYFPLFTTEAEKVAVGLKLRLTWAYKRVEQVETDRESYNDNNIFGAKIEQLELNFEKRLADSRMPTVWSDEPPEGFDDEDDR